MRLLLFAFVLCWNIIDLNGVYFQCDPNLPCGCGQKPVEMGTYRIINGEEAIPSSWPMIVSIRYDFFQDGNIFRHACGGTILTDSYILTSASCLEIVIENIQTANITIAAGIHRRSQPIQIIRDVDDAIVHPNWTGSAWSSDFDIALLHLSEPLDTLTNSMLTRTCIPSQIDDYNQLINYPPTNTTLAVIGWGRVNPFGDDSDALRQMMVAAIDPTNPKCMQIIPNTTRQFCAGVHLDSIGPCYGDFGSPIFQWMKNHWEQIGIASYTQDGCKKTTVIGYTRLAYFRDWIDENLQNSNDTIEEIPDTTTMPTTTEKPARIYECDRNIVPCGCGRRNVRLSSKNSTESIPHSWSTIVSIRLNNQTKHSCTGTILSESFILTSASCLFNASAFGITIHASIHNSSDENAIVRRVDRIYFHPQYQGFQIDQNQHDIAILHLTEEFIFENNMFLNRICLPERYIFLPDSIFYPQLDAKLVTVGWGLMNCPTNTQQDLLQQIEVTVQDGSQSNCYILNSNRAIQFCTGLNTTESDTCVRDPGSPIFEWLRDRWQQVGISTYGIDCKQFQNQGIYTRLIDYTDWIHSIINTCTETSTTTTVSTTTPWIQPITTPTRVIPSETTTRKPSKPPHVYNCNSSSTCGCGSVPVVLSPMRIVGGENALKYSWPMMVIIRWQREDMYWCGGTILSESYILTAAHCVEPYHLNPPQLLWITVGVNDRTDPQGIQRTVDYMYAHPNFTNVESDRNHDIALLHLSEPLSFENKLLVTKSCIHPLPSSISNQDSIANRTRLTVIGWGKQDVMVQDLPIDLQQVEVHAIHNDEVICKNSIHDTASQFCAGSEEGGKDSCGGDSGGPIFRWAGQYWEQVGIVSYGYNGCADAANPGIYTRLSYYYDWINDILKNDNQHTEPQVSSNEMTVNPPNTTRTAFDSTARTSDEIALNISTTTEGVINNNTERSNGSKSSAKINNLIYSNHIFFFFIYIFFNLYIINE